MPGPFQVVPETGTPERALYDEWAGRPAEDPSSDIPARLAELEAERAAAEAEVQQAREDALREVADTPVVEESIVKAFGYRGHTVVADRQRDGDREVWVVRVPQNVRVWACVMDERMVLPPDRVFAVAGNLARLSYEAEQHRLKGIEAGRAALALFAPEGWMDDAVPPAPRRVTAQ